MPRFRLTLAIALVAVTLVLPAPNGQAQGTPAQSLPHMGQTGSRRAPRAPVVLVPRSSSAERPATKARYGEPIKLPGRARRQRGEKQALPERGSAGGGSVTSVVISSLAIVLGLFFLVIWLARRALPKSSSVLPTDVLEFLGRSPLANRHHLQLLRLGRRLLLISVSPDSAETLTEITDPDEVNHVASLCRQHAPDSITGSFRQVLHQLGTQRTPRSRRSRRTDDRLDVETVTDPRATATPRHARELT